MMHIILLTVWCQDIKCLLSITPFPPGDSEGLRERQLEIWQVKDEWVGTQRDVVGNIIMEIKRVNDNKVKDCIYNTHTVYCSVTTVDWDTNHVFERRTERERDRQSDGERQTDRWTERDRQWGDNRVSCWKKEGFPPSCWAACVLFWKLVPWRMLRQPTGDTHTHSLTHSQCSPGEEWESMKLGTYLPKVSVCVPVCVFSASDGVPSYWWTKHSVIVNYHPLKKHHVLLGCVFRH